MGGRGGENKFSKKVVTFSGRIFSSYSFNGSAAEEAGVQTTLPSSSGAIMVRLRRPNEREQERERERERTRLRLNEIEVFTTAP